MSITVTEATNQIYNDILSDAYNISNDETGFNERVNALIRKKVSHLHLRQKESKNFGDRNIAIKLKLKMNEEHFEKATKRMQGMQRKSHIQALRPRRSPPSSAAIRSRKEVEIRNPPRSPTQEKYPSSHTRSPFKPLKSNGEQPDLPVGAFAPILGGGKRKSRRIGRRSRRKSRRIGRRSSRRSRRIGGLRKFNKTRRIPAPHYLLSPEEEGALQRVRNPPPASDRILSSSPSRSSLRKKRGLHNLPSVKVSRREIYVSPIGATKIAADAEKRRLRSIKDLYIQRVTNEKRLKKAREHASAQPPKDSLINSLIKKINPIFDLAT